MVRDLFFGHGSILVQSAIMEDTKDHVLVLTEGLGTGKIGEENPMCPSGQKNPIMDNAVILHFKRLGSLEVLIEQANKVKKNMQDGV